MIRYDIHIYSLTSPSEGPEKSSLPLPSSLHSISGRAPPRCAQSSADTTRSAWPRPTVLGPQDEVHSGTGDKSGWLGWAGWGRWILDLLGPWSHHFKSFQVHIDYIDGWVGDLTFPPFHIDQNSPYRDPKAAEDIPSGFNMFLPTSRDQKGQNMQPSFSHGFSIHLGSDVLLRSGPAPGAEPQSSHERFGTSSPAGSTIMYKARA